MQSASGACYAPTAVERRGAFGAGEYGCRSDYIFGVAADLIFGISIIFYYFQKSHFLERTGNMDQTRQNKKKTQRESNQEKTRKLTLSAMFFALGIVLPFWIGQIPAIGKVLLPMHIPVLLCGLIVGWKYGFAVGFLLPIVRGMLFGMPKLFPNGMAMAVELGTYGLVIGLAYGHSKWKNMLALYRSLIIAMLAGRIVWALAEVVLLGVTGSVFTWQMFMAGAFLNAIPGIILQLVLIPTVMMALDRANVLKLSQTERA